MTGDRPRSSREAQRQRRLEAALRDNLKKRKALTRERNSPEDTVNGNDADRTGTAGSGAGAFGGDTPDAVE